MSYELDAARKSHPVLEMDAVEAYGCEPAPLVRDYVHSERSLPSEYMLRVGGRKRRVYSWVEGAASALYVIKGGVYNFLSDEVETMLTHGNPQYGQLTPVAFGAKVIS